MVVSSPLPEFVFTFVMGHDIILTTSGRGKNGGTRGKRFFLFCCFSIFNPKYWSNHILFIIYNFVKETGFLIKNRRLKFYSY